MKSSSKKINQLHELKNKLRGLLSNYKSQGFTKGQPRFSTPTLRSGLRELYLEARVAINPPQFDFFISWINKQILAQISNFVNLSIGYEELSGVITGVPRATLERELLWITARIKAEALTLNEFRRNVILIERLVFTGKTEDAIEVLQSIEKAFGASLWSVQLRIALEHQTGGLERQKRYTAEIRKIYKRGLLSFVSYHTSVRNEDRSSLSKFCEDIKLRIDKHQYYDSSIKAYMRYRLTGEWPATHTGLADILRIEQSHSLIDIYETYISVVQELIRRQSSPQIHLLLLGCLDSLLSMAKIEDFRLTKASFLLNGGITCAALTARDTEVSDALFPGRVTLAAKTARTMVARLQPMDPWPIIYSGITFAHCRCQQSDIPCHPNYVIKLLATMFSRNDSSYNSFESLRKLATNLSGLTTAVGLLELLKMTRHTSPDERWRPWLVGLNSPTFGVEDIVPSNDPASFPAIFSEHQISGPTLTAWREFHVIQQTESDEGLNPVLQLFRAAGLLREGQHQRVVDILSNRFIGHRSEPLRSIAYTMILHAHFRLNNRQQVIELIADEGTRNETSCQWLPILSALDHYVWNDYKAVMSPLAAPIALYLLWRANEDRNTLSLLRYATATIFRTHGVARPSNLLDFPDKYPQRQLFYFLREICVPQILDVSRVLKSSREVFEERKNICIALRYLDPLNAGKYEDEAITISNQLALDEGQWIVDRTRIYVDTEALSRWASRELSEGFARYRDLLELNIEEFQNFDDILKELIGGTSSIISAFNPQSEADAILVGMLHQLRDEFLNNPRFGFDFYLSKRVRHQSFIGLIRSPLEFCNFITTRESESGKYHSNEIWLEKFTLNSTEIKLSIDDAFKKFAKSFDDTLIAAKDTKFHVRSQKSPDGLLYFDLTPQLVSVVRSIVRMDTTLPDFISTVVAVFWAALEQSLSNVRNFISDDLKTSIVGIFDEFRATVRKLVEHDPVFLDFDLEIGNCSTKVQRALDEVSKWFFHADLEAYKRTFALDQMVNIAIDSALKCHRTFEPEIELRVEGDVEMQATSLVFIHDVLFVALGNVRNHADIKKPKVNIEVQANVEAGNLTIIVISDSRAHNQPKHKEELRKIRECIEVGNFGPYTRNEGRSGLLKLAAVVSQSTRGKIDFGFTDAGQFRLSVTYSMIIQT